MSAAPPSGAPPPLVRLREVHKSYRLGVGTVEALRGVDLEVARGEFVAVWGPSGSGKSTLCNLAGLVDTPSAGTVLVDGRDAASLDDNQRSDHRNRTVGFVFQRFNLVPVLSATENVALPLIIGGRPAAAARRRAGELLAELGLGDRLDQRPDRLSGGQQQRVAIARALVTTPPLVIADEPTANLDRENALRIVALMRELGDRHGTTFLFATHDQRLLERVRRLVRLEDGRVVEDRVLP